MGLFDKKKFNDKSRKAWSALVLMIREEELLVPTARLSKLPNVVGFICSGKERGLTGREKKSVWWAYRTLQGNTAYFNLGHDWSQFAKWAREKAKRYDLENPVSTMKRRRWSNCFMVIGAALATIAAVAGTIVSLGTAAPALAAGAAAVIGVTAAQLAAGAVVVGGLATGGAALARMAQKRLNGQPVGLDDFSEVVRGGLMAAGRAGEDALVWLENMEGNVRDFLEESAGALPPEVLAIAQGVAGAGGFGPFLGEVQRAYGPEGVTWVRSWASQYPELADLA